MNRTSTKKVIAVLFIFSFLLTVVNYLWINKNLSHVPPPWDAAAYMDISLHDYYGLVKGNPLQGINTILKQAPCQAPLFPLTSVPFYIVFGPDIAVAYLTNFIYLFILFISVYCITEGLSGEKAGFLAVFLIATFPAVIAYSRDYLFEFPLAAMVALSYLFLIKSELFQDKKYSILFGLSAGLSVLTKTMGMIFFVMPFFYGIYIYTKSTSKTTRKNIIISFVIAFLVASVYYVTNFKDIFGYLFYFGFGKGSNWYTADLPAYLSLGNWTHYLESIAYRGISAGYALIFLITGILSLCRKDKKPLKTMYMIWLWFISGYFLLSIVPNKGFERFALPIIPPLAILIASQTMSISWKPLKVLIVFLVISIGALNYTYQTKTQNCQYEERHYGSIPLLIPIQITCNMHHWAQIPYEKNWNITPILEYLDTHAGADSKTIHVLIAVDHNFLNYSNLTLYATLLKLKGLLHSDIVFESVAYKPNEEETIKQCIERNHFIVAKTGYQGPDFSNSNNHIVMRLIKDFTPLESFIMSDGSKVTLYQSTNTE
jgi:hypothetical protein